MNTITYNTQFVFPEVKEWHITVGANGMYQTSKNKAEEVLIPEYDLFDIGGFVYVQRYFKKLTLSGGARYDHRSLDSKEFFDGAIQKFQAFNASFSNFSGSLGVSYEPADFLTIKANLARGFRAPNIAELGSNGVHEGTFRYEYGNMDLNSETSLQFDGGVEVNYEHFNLGINVFYNRMHNFIFYRKLGICSENNQQALRVYFHFYCRRRGVCPMILEFQQYTKISWRGDFGFICNPVIKE